MDIAFCFRSAAANTHMILRGEMNLFMAKTRRHNVNYYDMTLRMAARAVHHHTMDMRRLLPRECHDRGAIDVLTSNTSLVS